MTRRTARRGHGIGLRGQVDAVVDEGNCTGCGACAAICPQIEMALDAHGFARPTWVDGSATGTPDQVETFLDMCPGVVVRRPAATDDAEHHPVLGSFVSAWTGWAADPETRWRGSSGGVLTALSAWLLDTGLVVDVVGAAMSDTDRRRTVAVRVQGASDVARTAGSRYAPVGTAALFVPDQPDSALVGKPCEVAAARRLLDRRGKRGDQAPVLLSFFCAGVPSQLATDGLVAGLGVDPRPDGLLRYRGQGWPGDFVVEDGRGGQARRTYEQSWGEHLGRQVQDRCKICPDGLGGDADISVGDFWRADDAGYPVFDDSPGRSVVLARTPRGHDLLLLAAEQNAVVLGPVTLDDVAAVQPLQRRRQIELPGRLVGRVLAGRRVPRYPGFGTVATALRSPRRTVRAARGAFARARAGRVSGDTPDRTK